MNYKEYIEWFDKNYTGDNLKELLFVLTEKKVSTRDKVLIVKKALDISIPEADSIILNNSCTERELNNIAYYRNCITKIINKEEKGVPPQK